MPTSIELRRNHSIPSLRRAAECPAGLQHPNGRSASCRQFKCRALHRLERRQRRLGQTQTYYLDVPAGENYNFSALVTWNRQIAYAAGTGGAAATFCAVAGPDRSRSLPGQRRSPISAHWSIRAFRPSTTSRTFFERDLPSGRYALQLSRADTLSTDPGNYGLAWQLLPASPFWTAAVSGSWTDASKWSSTPAVPGGAGQTVVLNAASTAPLTVTLDGPQTVGTLVFGNSTGSTTGYTLSAGSAARVDLGQQRQRGPDYRCRRYARDFGAGHFERQPERFAFRRFIVADRRQHQFRAAAVRRSA